MPCFHPNKYLPLSIFSSLLQAWYHMLLVPWTKEGFLSCLEASRWDFCLTVRNNLKTFNQIVNRKPLLGLIMAMVVHILSMHTLTQTLWQSTYEKLIVLCCFVLTGNYAWQVIMKLKTSQKTSKRWTSTYLIVCHQQRTTTWHFLHVCEAPTFQLNHKLMASITQRSDVDIHSFHLSKH